MKKEKKHEYKSLQLMTTLVYSLKKSWNKMFCLVPSKQMVDVLEYCLLRAVENSRKISCRYIDRDDR